MIANLVCNPAEPNDYLGCPTSIWFRKIIWKDISWLHEMFTKYGYTEWTFSTKAGVYVWWMDPVWLVMKDPTLGCPEQSFETFQGLRGRWQLLGGTFGVQMCSLPACGVLESLPAYWSLENTSYLLVPENSCSSLNPCSFWPYTSCYSQVS